MWTAANILNKQSRMADSGEVLQLGGWARTKVTQDYGSGSENLKESNHLRDLCIDGRVILKKMLRR
jgi:hypothetical protein